MGTFVRKVLFGVKKCETSCGVRSQNGEEEEVDDDDNAELNKKKSRRKIITNINSKYS